MKVKRRKVADPAAGLGEFDGVLIPLRASELRDWGREEFLSHGRGLCLPEAERYLNEPAFRAAVDRLAPRRKETQ